MRTIKLLLTMTLGAISSSVFSAAIDTNGNPVTNATEIGDIDTRATTVGDLKGVIAPDYQSVSNAAVNAVQWHYTPFSNIVVGPISSAGFGSIVMGNEDGNISIGAHSSVFGDDNTIGNYSSVLGNNNVAGDYAFALGYKHNLNSGKHNAAFGYYNKADSTSTFSYLLGVGNTVGSKDSFALGTVASATNAGSFVWNWYMADYFTMDTLGIEALPHYYSHGDGTFNINPIGGLSGLWIGETNMEEHIQNEVSDTALQGYGWPFGVWGHNQPDLNLSTPVWTNNLWRYTETNSLGQIIGSPRWIEVAAGIDATELTDTLNGTNVIWTRVGTAIYTNKLGLATIDNLSQYVKQTQLESTLTDYVSNETLNNYDASYKMVEGISTENQTIQFVLNTNGVSSTLEIMLPESGRCKDWIVYVLSDTDMPLSLPSASYWIKSEAVTNSIAAGVPTALYFSQISAEGLYTIGRQEFTTPITVVANRGKPMLGTMQKILSTTNKDKKKNFIRGRVGMPKPVIKK